MMGLNRIILVLATLFLVVLALTGCVTITGEETVPETTTTTSKPPTVTTSEPSATLATAPRVGRLAPGFELVDLDGQPVSLESLRGRYVMLNFWATWCGPCRYEMPFIQEIYEDSEWSKAGLLIVAVNIGESVSQVKAFMDGFNFGFRVLLDSGEQTAVAYNIRGIPTTFLIDRDGIIRDIKVGPFLDRAEIETKLTDLIGG
jgi:thiol-disulfide isomerase/thioredoxin